MRASPLNSGQIPGNAHLGKDFLNPELAKDPSAGSIGDSEPGSTPDYFEKELPDILSNVKDDKAARMFMIHADEDFDNNKINGQMRALVLIWIIRFKINQSLKRLLDLIISVPAFLFFSPSHAADRFGDKGGFTGPIHLQAGPGREMGENFNCYKFRSMFVDAEKRKQELLHLNEADKIVFKMKRDPRVTRVGRIIRKFSIDELPQIMNVIKGDMSLVGPRPPVPYEVDHYDFDHILRLNAMPGITGLQQISGRSELEFKRWIELDLKVHRRTKLAQRYRNFDKNHTSRHFWEGRLLNNA